MGAARRDEMMPTRLCQVCVKNGQAFIHRSKDVGEALLFQTLFYRFRVLRFNRLWAVAQYCFFMVSYAGFLLA